MLLQRIKDTKKDSFQTVRGGGRFPQAQQRDIAVTIETKVFEFNVSRVPKRNSLHLLELGHNLARSIFIPFDDLS